MTKPLLAQQDRPIVAQITDNLPQSLLLVAESGLDVDLVVEQLINSEPSEVYKIHPPEKKHTIGVDQVRDLKIKVRTHATNRRIVVIDPASIMTEEAQNALLKMLEEPSAGLNFILVAESVEPILETIISRCQVVGLSRTSQAQDKELISSYELSNSDVQQILFLASGRPKMIRQLAAEPEELDQYRQLATDAKTILADKSYESLKLIGRYSSDRQTALKLIDILLAMISFQAKKRGLDSRQQLLIDRANVASERLRQNASIKLALLELAVR